MFVKTTKQGRVKRFLELLNEKLSGLTAREQNQVIGQLLERVPKLRRKTDDGESGKRRFKERVDTDG